MPRIITEEAFRYESEEVSNHNFTVDLHAVDLRSKDRAERFGGQVSE